MDLIEDNYQPEITTQSQTELIKLTRWQKDNLGDWSTIIGGWAIWSYCKGAFGSRDIDLVLPIDESQQISILQKYFPENNITEKSLDAFGERVYYSKDITFGKNGNDEIVFDLFYPKIPRPDNDNLGVQVDWKWTFDYCKDEPMGEDSFISIPNPELLLPLKIVAALSRAEAMKTEGRDDKLRRLRSKVWKDYYDVAILIKNVDFMNDELKMHLNNIGINERLRNSFLQGYANRSDILSTIGISYIQIADKIPK